MMPFPKEIFDSPLSRSDFIMVASYLTTAINKRELKTPNVDDVVTYETSAQGFKVLVNGLGQSIDDLPALFSVFGSLCWMEKGHVSRRNDKPAIINPDGKELYYVDGLLHRDGDKPTVVPRDCSFEYHRKGQRHRDGDKPAWVNTQLGMVSFYCNGQLHRGQGLAASITVGDVHHWYEHGVLYMLYVPGGKYEILNQEMADRIALTADPSSPLVNGFKPPKIYEVVQDVTRANFLPEHEKPSASVKKTSPGTKPRVPAKLFVPKAAKPVAKKTDAKPSKPEVKPKAKPASKPKAKPVTKNVIASKTAAEHSLKTNRPRKLIK